MLYVYPREVILHLIFMIQIKISQKIHKSSLSPPSHSASIKYMNHIFQLLKQNYLPNAAWTIVCESFFILCLFGAESCSWRLWEKELHIRAGSDWLVTFAYITFFFFWRQWILKRLACCVLSSGLLYKSQCDSGSVGCVPNCEMADCLLCFRTMIMFYIKNKNKNWKSSWGNFW